MDTEEPKMDEMTIQQRNEDRIRRGEKTIGMLTVEWWNKMIEYKKSLKIKK